MSSSETTAPLRRVAPRDVTRGVLAVLVTTGFLAMVAGLMFTNVSLEAREILNIMAGVLGTAFATVLGYYFGGSKGGDELVKDVAGSKRVPS